RPRPSNSFAGFSPGRTLRIATSESAMPIPREAGGIFALQRIPPAMCPQRYPRHWGYVRERRRTPVNALRLQIPQKAEGFKDWGGLLWTGGVVPRGGIEPPTLRFSVACSTN